MSLVYKAIGRLITNSNICATTLHHFKVIKVSTLHHELTTTPEITKSTTAVSTVWFRLFCYVAPFPRAERWSTNLTQNDHKCNSDDPLSRCKTETKISKHWPIILRKSLDVVCITYVLHERRTSTKNEFSITLPNSNNF